MGLFDAFKKKKNDNKKLSSYEENALRLGGVHAIIAIKWGEEGTKQAVAECKDIINTIISEMDVHRKTEVLEYGLDFCEELLTRNQQKHPELTLGRNCITAFIYYRFFFECVLSLDSDILQINEIYTVYQCTKIIDERMHPYVQAMIKIYDLLDRGIIYHYENEESISKNYFAIVADKIRGITSSYVDDNSDWNKIEVG